jgi:hypothetical protein
VSPSGGSKNILYYVVAFAIGYREETFRTLIKRVLDVLLAPGTTNGVQPAILSINPSSGPSAGGTRVAITGAGLSTAKAVKFGPASATDFTIDSDHHVTATTPQVTATGPVNVTVQLKDSAVTGPVFTYTG